MKHETTINFTAKLEENGEIGISIKDLNGDKTPEFCQAQLSIIIMLMFKNSERVIAHFLDKLDAEKQITTNINIICEETDDDITLDMNVKDGMGYLFLNFIKEQYAEFEVEE
ncbi:hypothetical protein A6046_03245 [[Haemophilus] ducreyi]|uniref:Uncharacterized protein n=2 Tax=Haemophilus ducreyi TaxID=730 RepID=Q7VPH5_HAEDU|nr:hypothetical protein [[Haemophilus] ducreyi]AAP95106.1 hypothetical protein HD_0103 [[Haemophilus] ducreyi 35000HP]AKO30282.1 hypothetical protein RY60_00395 [[Haemophilus] ducreyi]AKO31715.1 hypothetical protein RZ57_00400 [[Haemophilus] ducreyi]AKO33168.1 hypothetical protein RZ58_00400 [[Haemophilus] ducreyi]AKO34617.1 hypothetical protein RZ59_00395 [[Haemophilus] ducreyi]